MKLIIFTCLLGVSLSMQVYPVEWLSFKAMHGKQYASAEEEILRMSIFMENKQKIEAHNARFQQGLTTYTMKMNHLGDMLPHEIKAKLNGLNFTRSIEAPLYSYDADKAVPDSFDWRTKGAVTPVKNQGQCGSCWAFSAVGALETQLWKKTGKLVSLSEQNLIDCSWDEGNSGCGGGLMDQAFTYVKSNRGIDKESSYPYEGNSGECRYQPKDSAGFDVGFEDITQGDENALKSAVASIGPISVGIDASSFGFMYYSNGILNDLDCSSTQLDHGVLAVGYGTENGNDFWIVKNSWGPSWGDNGYIKMSRNKDNQCGISTAASYPVV